MEFKQKIKDRGLKITWIAEQIGITRSLLSQYLNGLRNMPDHIEVKLKEMLN